MANRFILCTAFILLTLVSVGFAIQCFQCDSNEDTSCPSSRWFDTSINALVDCNSFEANVPGQFCMKIYQESPGWGGWKKITRRCGSRTDFGVAWGCRWSWDYTGVFRETCYCEDRPGCNSAARFPINLKVMIGVIISIIIKSRIMSY